MEWLCPILIVVAIAWIVIGLIRSFTGAGRGGPAPGSYAGGGYGGGPGDGGGGGGGGGFMSSLVGGMFGAAAGNWMYVLVLPWRPLGRRNDGRRRWTYARSPRRRA